MATYDVTTDAGKVRLLISDVGGDDGASFLFEDNEIAAFLTMQGDSVRLAAAQALRTMAANEAMVSKVIKWLDLSTDGAKVADSLRQLASELEVAEEEETPIGIAEMNVGTFAARDMRENKRIKAS